MVIHKLKEIRPVNEVQLLNKDGSWNILCNTFSSNVKANPVIDFVTCKRCLKLFHNCNGECNQ